MNETRSSVCIPCEATMGAEYYSSVGSSGCYLCQKSFFMVDGRCQPCPPGADCTAAGSTLEHLNISSGQYRFTSSSRTVYPCPYPANCKQGGSVGGEVCMTGSHGPLCGLCDDEYYLYGPALGCVECDNWVGSDSFMVTMGCAVVAGMLVGWLIVRGVRKRWSRWRRAKDRESRGRSRAESGASLGGGAPPDGEGVVEVVETKPGGGGAVNVGGRKGAGVGAGGREGKGRGRDGGDAGAQAGYTSDDPSDDPPPPKRTLSFGRTLSTSHMKRVVAKRFQSMAQWQKNNEDKLTDLLECVSIFIITIQTLVLVSVNHEVG